MPENPSNFEYWKHKFPAADRSVLRTDKITSRTLFVYFEVCPLVAPSMACFGCWQWFSEARTLAGYLRHVLIPDMLGDWLARNDWDNDPNSLIPSEELFERAVRAELDNKYLEDLPLIRDLLGRIDELFSRSDEEIIIGLSQITDELDERWNETGTWTFRIDIFFGPVKAGDALYEMGCVGKFGDVESKSGREKVSRDIEKREWLLACSRVDEDPETMWRVIEQFGRSYDT